MSATWLRAGTTALLLLAGSERDRTVRRPSQTAPELLRRRFTTEELNPLRDKPSLFKRIADQSGLTEAVEELKADNNVSSWADVKRSWAATPPGRDASLEELLAYIELAGDITAHAGDHPSRNLVNPVVALCRANLGSEPALVRELVHRIMGPTWSRRGL